MDDTISRQAAIRAVNTALFPKINTAKDAEKALRDLPSAQPEIKPIDYQDCANAMLRMWMDEVVTDGEYNRIMDKLNTFWRTRNERSD